jgi:broad specificity phosphatase PhoE
LNEHLKGERIDSFYSGPYDGAFATASTLAAGHRRGVIRIRDLQEMDFGEWTGKTAQEVKASDPEQLVVWQFKPHQHRMPGGENLEEVQVRTVEALEHIISVEQGNSVCVVAHAIPIKTAMCHFMNEDLSIIWLAPPQESTALNVIAIADDGVKVALLGSLDHLGQESPT